MIAGTLLAVGHGALLQAAAALPGPAGLPVLGALLGGASPAPSPSPSTIEIPPEDQTSPGFLGFVVTFGVAVVVILLGFSLVRHLRLVERNGRRLEAEEAEAATSAAAAGAATEGAADGTGRADADEAAAEDLARDDGPQDRRPDGDERRDQP